VIEEISIKNLGVIGEARLPLKAGQWLHVEHFVAEEGS